jgi:dihydrofolate reductase
MRKIILSVNVTLDGFMAGPNGELDWHFDHWNEEMAQQAIQQLRSVGGILVGRVTYEAMAAYWPMAPEHKSTDTDIEFATLMNNLPKIVFSKTLNGVKWNNSRLAKANIREEIAELKRQEGKDLVIWGGVGIVHTFIKLGLIDEYRLWVAPVVLGKGKPLFVSSRHTFDLKLSGVKTFNNSVALLYYQLK